VATGTPELRGPRAPSSLVNSILASSCASALHWTLMWIKHHFHILPGFDPYRDLQASMGAAFGLAADSPGALALSYVNAALLWGFLYAQLQPRLPGRRWIVKGSLFGLLIWLLLGLVFLPLLGHRIFALDADLGAGPAILMLVMVLAYALLISLIYERLAARGSRLVAAKPPL
jgi:Family of unknown function (DUF6789)